MPIFRFQRTRDYTIMSNQHLRNPALSLKSKGLLSMMLSLPDEWNYTNRGLAKMCKEGVDAIGTALRELEAAGYIVRNQLRNEKGQITDTEYIIYEQPQDKPSEPCPPSSKPPKSGAAEPKKGKTGKRKAAPSGTAAASEPTDGLQCPGIEPEASDSSEALPNTAFPYTTLPYTENPDTVKPYTEMPAQLNTNRIITNRSNTDKSITDSIPFLSYPFSSYPISEEAVVRLTEEKRKEAVTNTRVESYREQILENIEYEHLWRGFPDRRAELDEIVELIVETVCAKRKVMRIASGDFDAEIVRQRFLNLNSDHICYVMQCLKNNTTEIRNMKQYLLTVLFNSVTTMSNYTASQVNHDMVSPDF